MDPDQSPINRPAPESAVRVSAQHLRWAIEEKALWPLGDALRALFEVVRWPFERLYWALEDRIPALAGRGRFAAAGGAALIVGVLAVGVIALAGSGGSTEQAADQVAVATPAPATGEPAPAPAPQPEKAEPTLHGAAPSFEPQAAPKQKDSAGKSSDAGGQRAEEGTAATSSTAATEKISSEPSATSSSAATPAETGGESESEAIPGRPAGPEAVAVARRFSQAFVVYETGGEESLVRKAFATTTTPALAKALLRRPPRLPADVKVPKAKVVTVVPGPSREGVYTLSVSLLRVGVTSELRLEMEKLKGKGWRVTNVLG
jgi:hypothetical protein